MRKSLNIFSSIACNSTIASNKLTQEQYNLAAIQRAKLKGAHETPKSQTRLITQIWTLTRIDKEVIEDYHDKKTLDENVT